MDSTTAISLPLRRPAPAPALHCSVLGASHLVAQENHTLVSHILLLFHVTTLIKYSFGLEILVWIYNI